MLLEINVLKMLKTLIKLNLKDLRHLLRRNGPKVLKKLQEVCEESQKPFGAMIKKIRGLHLVIMIGYE